MKQVRTLVVVLALAWGLLAGAAPALAASCGDTITADTTLTADLTCSGTALVIGADGITLDLNGFRLRGDGTGSGVFDGAGHSGFTIRNGHIEHFEYGIYLIGPATGVDFRTLEDLRITRNTDAGIRIEAAREVNIDRVRSSRNGTAANLTGEGLDLIRTLQVFVSDSAFVANLQNGIRMDQAEETGISSSRMRGNRVAGIDLAFAVDSFIRGNRISRNDVGVLFTGASGHRLEGNAIVGNGGGVVVQADPGGAASLLNTFAGNRIAGNRLDGMRFEDPLTTTTAVSANGIRRNGANGITVVDGELDIDANRIARNAADGLRLAGGTEVVTANRLFRNGGWGLFAEPAASPSGGGNVAVGNGAGQCNVPGLC